MARQTRRGPPQRPRGRPTDPDRNLALAGPGCEAAVVHVSPKRRLDVRILVGERGADDVDGCVSDFAALVEVDLEQLELTLEMPGAHTEDDATTGKFVERHERLCRLDRMAIAHDVDV